MIKMIWAQTQNGVIGAQGKLPWNIKEEMQHFIRTTKGQDVLMGSKTFDSMNKKPLPGRTNYVLTNSKEKYQDLNFENLIIISDITELVKKYTNNDQNNLFVIGGNVVYTLFFPFANEIIKTVVKNDYQGDTFISNFDYKNFKLESSEDYPEFIIEYWKRGY
ncbi:dihydrofolate reductase [Williamsoniiplasma somnilux]|uniref:dihydrofolate reductase n=1 Tax=Williamsoniiplasma somnilux TaxID=215578 RepID=A0A2K8NXX9_9MOLU|nr:dihydrofolate reductase [Williamsoniiplasma somnilux]ATZ18679.1 dihydrofolate reductase [Williamsoniiplasma somnilux]